MCFVDVTGVDRMVRSSSSTDDQPVSSCDEVAEYSKCKKREEAPLDFHAPSGLPADISSCHMKDSKNALSSASPNPTSEQGPQPAPSALADTSNNESEHNLESEFTVHVNEHDVDAAAEEHVDEDDDNDEQENDEADADVYQAASEVSTNTNSYSFAHVLDVNTVVNLPDYDTLSAVSEPTSDSASTSCSYWRAQVAPDDVTDSSGSGGISIDQSPDGNSEVSTTTADGSQSPESDSGYCAAELFAN